MFILLTASTAPLHAQAAKNPPIVVNAIVYGPQGNEVGTISKIDGANIILNTGANEATLPMTVLGRSKGKLTITYTKAQMDAAISAAGAKQQQQMAAKLDAALVVGAPVHTADGTALGSVKSIDADGSVVIERAVGPLGFKRSQFTTDANGLAITLTAQQLDELLATPAAKP